MKKAAEAFRSIGEVSQLVGVAPHVLRYWESQFPLFSPVKRRDGRRYYRPDDIRLAAGLCELLRMDGVTIRGAKKQMAADRGAALKARGAARLGGDFADVPPATESAMPDSHDLTAAAPNGKSPNGGPARGRRKQPAPLPLFADIDSQPASDSPAPAAAPSRPAASAGPDPASAGWLTRLTALRVELRVPLALPPQDAKAVLSRLEKARRSLAA